MGQKSRLFFQNYWLLLLVLGVLVIIFRAFFRPEILSGGDLEYVWNYDFFNLHMPAWNIKKEDGLGVFFVPYLWAYLTMTIPITVFGKLLGLPWMIVERLALFYPVIILSTFSSILFARRMFIKAPFYYLAPLIFVVNTYILSIIQGGQLLYALAYALTPITILVSFGLIDSSKPTFRKSLLVGVVLALQLVLDIRVGYMLLFITALYFLFHQLVLREKVSGLVKRGIFTFIVPGAIAVLLHSFWVLPIITFKNQQLGDSIVSYGTTYMVQFLSFAKLEDTLSLLHPNWPDNIFGKTYLMRSEFIIVPLLAFISLLFLRRQKDSSNSARLRILFFAGIGLLGAFLAKGTNDPQGGIYLWLFEHIPGFVMFRDPTKWYLIIALSYTILIPFSISQIFAWLKLRQKLQDHPKLFSHANIWLVTVVCSLVLLVHPAVKGTLTGTFKPHAIPQGYHKLAQFLDIQSDFSRTLWLPTVYRYTYYSNTHPSISASELFRTSSPSALLTILRRGDVYNRLQENAIRYIVVPFDSEKELFLTDRRFDSHIYNRYVSELQKIPWLSEIKRFEDVRVFALDSRKSHVWSFSPELQVSTSAKSPSHYVVSIANAKRGDQIVFSEKYDPHWQLRIRNRLISPERYKQLSVFTLPTRGESTGELVYTVQESVNAGIVISLLTFFGIIVYLGVGTLMQRRK